MPVLGYWKLRGLAQPIRLLLAHTGTDYEEKLYTLGGAPDFDRSEWLNEKFTLGLELPNIPYYIDGNVKLTQSLAILRYLAKKNGLMGKTELEQTRIDMIEQHIFDCNYRFSMMCYGVAFMGNTDFEKMKSDYIESMPELLKMLDQLVNERKWVAGDNLTYVDFLLYEFIDKQILFAAEQVKPFANLMRHHQQIEELPNVKKYMQSDKFIKWPLNGTMAKWGGN